MDNLPDTDLLEQYLRGELSKTATTDLETRLQKEKELAIQFAELKELQQGIRYAQLRELLGDMNSWETKEKPLADFENDLSDSIRLKRNQGILAEIEGFEEEIKSEEVKKVSVGRRYWLGVAAGVLLLIGTALFLFQPEEQLTNEELFAMYFEPYPANMVKRGGEVDSLMMGYVAYESGDYETAIELFEVHGDTLAQFFLGVSYLAMGEAELAIEQFNDFQNNNLPILKEQVLYYDALALLKLNDKKGAILKIIEVDKTNNLKIDEFFKNLKNDK